MVTEPKCRYCKAPIRHPGCQSHCEHYKKWKEEWDKQAEQLKKERWLKSLK